MVLNIIRTGSTWTSSSSFWAGRKDTNLCRLCGEEKETVEHILWYCKCLKEARLNADKQLAECNPDIFPTAAKHGIAPAMATHPEQPFWGEFEGAEHDYTKLTKQEAKLIGCSLKIIPADCRQVIEATKGQ